MTEPWGRPYLKVLEGPIEPFTHTLSVSFMDQEDSHSEAKRNAHLRHFHQYSGMPSMIVRPTKVKESSNGASALG